jgi:hypothetical protein
MLPTKNGLLKLPKYCCWARDRHGKWRVRFRRNGYNVYLTGAFSKEPDSYRGYADLMWQYQVANRVACEQNATQVCLTSSSQLSNRELSY